MASNFQAIMQLRQKLKAFNMCKTLDIGCGCESARLPSSLPRSLEARISDSRHRSEPALSNVEHHSHKTSKFNKNARTPESLADSTPELPRCPFSTTFAS